MPGTWDPAPGMLGGVTRRLDRKRFEIVYIRYPQTFALPVSYTMSKRIAIQHLREEWERDLKAPVVLLGYSQGADAVGDFAKVVQYHPRLKAIGLVADPKRPAATQIGALELSGHGIAGERTIDHPNVWQVATANDPICNASPGSLWRIVADTTQDASPLLPRWAVGLMRSWLRQGKVQLALPMSIGERLWGILCTLPELVAWLAGAHTSYGVLKCPGTDRCYLAELARLINSLD